jgi:quinol monooxygenase YgiN
MIHATIRILIPPKRRGEVLGILTTLAERSRFDPDCVSCRVYQDVELEPMILFDQIWTNKEALERYLRSEEFLKVLLIVDMSPEPPEIRFDEVSRSSGVETIEKARGV